MKRIILSAILFCVVSIQAHTIKLDIVDIKSDLKGNIQIALFAKKENFLKFDKYYKAKIIKANGDKMRYVFENIPKDTYAIALFHDINDNQKIDTNFFGIPKEGHGVSGNISSSFGPPEFESAKFLLTEDIELTIKVVY